MRQFGDLAGPFTGFDRLVHGGQDAVADGAEQRLLIGEVPVQRAGLHMQGTREPPHGQIGESVLIEDGDGPVDHVRAVQLH